MKEQIQELKWLGMKGDPVSLVKAHNAIIDAILAVPNEYIIDEIFCLRNQLQGLIYKNNLILDI